MPPNKFLTAEFLLPFHLYFYQSQESLRGYDSHRSLYILSKRNDFPNIFSSQIQVGPIVFEFLKPNNTSSIYQDCFDQRGEGITDFIYLVDDLKVEIEKLTQNGVNLIDSNKDFAILDTRKEGNILTRLIQS